MWIITVLFGLGSVFPFPIEYYAVGIILVLSIVGIRLILRQRISIYYDVANLSFVLLTVAASISLLLSSTNKIEALLSPLGLVTYLSACFLLLLGIRNRKLLFALVVLGAVVTVWRFVQQFPTLMPLSVAWQVMVRSYTGVQALLVGTGAENYISAYSLGRPAWIAASPLFMIRYTTSANLFLHVATVYGLVGIGAVLVLVRALVSPPVRLVILGVLLVVPPSPTLVILVALAIMLTAPKGNIHTITLHTSWKRYVAAGVCFILVLLGLYGVGRSGIALYSYRTAVREASENQGTPVYNAMIRALHYNPYVSSYHISYSQTNLALANSIAASVTENPEASEAGRLEKQQLAESLIEQAVREAKIAVNLNKRSVLAWENLGAVYSALIPAQGADQWAIEAYNKTLQLDPNNPALYLELGGIYTHQKQYDAAIEVYGKAITLRPSYANAYYNLANVYRLQGKTVEAMNALETVLSLVPTDSSDYFKATNELEALKNNSGGSESP